MLTGLQFVLRFLDSFVKIGVMIAHIKEDGNSEEFTVSLNTSKLCKKICIFLQNVHT